MKSFNLVRGNGSIIDNECHIENNQYLGIIFSGANYTYRNPLLYYSRNLLFDNKIDYFGIDFGYYRDGYYTKLTEDEKNKYFENDISIIINKILDISKQYKKIIFIGKSIGTIGIRRCFKNDSLMNKSSFVLLTPAIEWGEMINEIIYLENDFLIIGSRGDKHYMTENLNKIYNVKNINIYELADGDHSLEINDTMKDIEQLGIVCKKINDFIKYSIVKD